MSVEFVPAPAPAETSAPEQSLPADMPVHPANVGLPRDPVTGKFLPKDAQPVPAEKTPAPASSNGRTTGSEPVDGGSSPSAGTKPAEPLSDRFAILAKKERALRETDQAVKARLADIEKREAALKSGVVPQSEFKEKPLQALAKQLGLSIKEAYELVTQQALNGFDDPATPAEHAARLAREEVQKIRDELKAEREAALADARTAAKQEEAKVMEGFRQECHASLAANKETFELTNHFATGDDVYGLITDHWQRQIAAGTPAEKMRVLQIGEALQLLEEHFEKQVETGLKLKKVSAKVQPAPIPAPTQRTTPSDQPRALSNKMAASVTTTGEAPSPWDKEARLKRAEAAFEANRSIKPRG